MHWRAASPSAVSSASPMWSIWIPSSGRNRRAAAHSVWGDFSSRRCPTMSTRSHAVVLARVRRGVLDWKTTRALPRRASGRASGPWSCSTISRCASASERCALASVAMSRYRSVPVSASTSGRPGCACAHAAPEGGERRARRAGRGAGGGGGGRGGPLRLSAAYRGARGPALRVPCTPELNPPLWELGHIGWFADWWIARNPQRGLGTQADPLAPRAPARQATRGLDADALYNSSAVPHDRRWQLDLPGAQAVRADLAHSLADTLALLAQAPDDDAGLYFFRLALFHEDMHAEAAVYMAQTLGFDHLDALAPPATTANTAAPAP